jgi:putative ABC transport system permease protein
VNAVLAHRRLRSFLTTLSLAVGSGSLIAVLGISTIVAGTITESLHALGDPGFFVSVDPDQEDPQSAQIRYGDAAALADADPTLLRAVFPSYQHTYALTANGSKVSARIVSADGADNASAQAGRLVNADDNAFARHVCVLSSVSANHLFGDANPLESFVHINGVRFLVVGVDQAHKTSFLGSMGPSDYAEIPYSTFHAALPDPVDVLRVVSLPGAQPLRVREAILAALHRLHGKRSFYAVDDAHAVILEIQRSLETVAFALSAINGIALLIAGVGIMNAMLAAVTERTREIGIRKAIGAADNAIFMQFLREAVVVSSIGCGIGALFGCAATAIAQNVIGNLLGPTTVPWPRLIMFAVAYSFLTGILFGTYPAIRARALEPIRALRI